MTNHRDVIDIVTEWLNAHGCDGLANGEECGCSIADLAPCGHIGHGCMAASRSGYWPIEFPDAPPPKAEPEPEPPEPEPQPKSMLFSLIENGVYVSATMSDGRWPKLFVVSPRGEVTPFRLFSIEDQVDVFSTQADYKWGGTVYRFRLLERNAQMLSIVRRCYRQVWQGYTRDDVYRDILAVTGPPLDQSSLEHALRECWSRALMDEVLA